MFINNEFFQAGNKGYSGEFQMEMYKSKTKTTTAVAATTN